MNPPIVYELTIPRIHIIKRITKIVQSISFSFLYQLSELIQTIKHLCNIQTKLLSDIYCLVI
jgi:hypothetical protein